MNKLTHMVGFFSSGVCALMGVRRYVIVHMCACAGVRLANQGVTLRLWNTRRVSKAQ